MPTLFTHACVFAPWQPIAVSPIGAGFSSRRGLDVMLSELQRVWLPAAILALAGYALRRRVSALSSSR